MPFALRFFFYSALAIVAAAPGVARGQTSQNGERDDDAALEFFEKRVRPLLVENCYNCHSANTNSRGGLRVDDRNGLIAGGDRGPAVVPGDPEKGLLIQAVRQTHAKVKMPPNKRLSDEQIADLTQWIQDGAAWPQVHVPESLGKPNEWYADLRKEHWAWQPLREPNAPEVKRADWPRGDIDRFILAKLEAKGLEPVQQADPLPFIRRVTFDLTGLPPTLEEVDAFLGAWEAAGPNARQVVVEDLVDRLLASPAYGERWGRHWLDVARYAESTGSARNIPYPHAWRYRDYVVDAFNNDKPYDQFLREQIAGDLLLPAGQSPVGQSPVGRTILSAESNQESLPHATGRQEGLPHGVQDDERLVATGFLALGVCDVNQRFKVRFVMDNIDEQIDTVTRAVLGLTVSCARCHDHKFDPIPTTDYYALAGIFHSSDRCAGVRNKMGGSGMAYYDTNMLLRLGPVEETDRKVAEKAEQMQTELAQAQAELSALQAESEQDPSDSEREKEVVRLRQQIKKKQNEMVALNDPAAFGPVALGVRDAAAVGDTQIRIRGEAEQLGPVVPRGFLSAFEVPGAPQISPNQSGRLELAQWLASEHNPLTSRVMANRVWQRLFGQGLVSTVDNFGVTGDLPSHPELLDHLASRFIREGWSVKKLVRAVVLTRTYQLSSDVGQTFLSATEAATNQADENVRPTDGRPSQLTLDPANRLLWRHTPRRLDAEEIRDAMLAAAGRLDLNRPKGSPAQNFKVTELRTNGPEAKRLEEYCLASKHRSLYLPLLRGLTPQALAVFDFAEQGMVTGSRDTTTVATQALYLLNDPFVRQQSQALANRLLSRDETDDAGRIHLAYRLALNRPATAEEIDRATNYLTDYESAAREQSAKNPREAAWTSFCQALLASAEFRYIK